MNTDDIDKLAETLGSVYDILNVLSTTTPKNSPFDIDAINEKEVLLEYASGYINNCFHIIQTNPNP